MKQTPAFLIAHNNEAAKSSTFVVCTKNPSFIAKLIEFNSQEELENHILHLPSYLYRKLPNKHAVLEFHQFFGSESKHTADYERLFNKMGNWYIHYGETRG